MPRTGFPLTRRRFVSALGAFGVGALARGLPSIAADAAARIITKAVPAGGEKLAVIGMGTSRTFDVGNNEALRAARLGVLKAFFEMGGQVIDSSPMYGSSEEVLGYCLKALPEQSGLYSATKVWTKGREAGREQMAQSENLWGLESFDLMQVHNLMDWQTHLETLKAQKAEGRIRHIGITTSHGRRHAEFEAVMASQPLDFVQLSYNILDREAEARLLPLAAERGQAVMVNRPFRRGALFELVKGEKLPEWASEIGCSTWSQFFLKYAVSHADVTCAIPATRRADHMAENMGANMGLLPDAAMRKRMAAHMADL